MSELFFADRVRETCVATGAGALALAGAVPGFRRFAEAVPAGAAFPYAIAGETRREQWETGIGSLDGAGRLVRAPSASSAGGLAVDFSAGLKTVMLSVGADWFAGAGAAAPFEIAPGSVSNAMLASVPSASIKGRAAGAAGAPTDLTPVAARGVLGLGSAATAAIGTSGASVPLLNATNTFGAVTRIAAPGAPLVVNSTNGNGNKIVMQDGGVTSAYFGGSASVPFQVQNSAGQTMLGFSTASNASFGGAGYFAGVVSASSDNVHACGQPGVRWSVVYAASGTISTSDETAKKYVGAIPKAWLDAWGDVGWRRYKFRGAKGVRGGQRWHIGLIAQRVHGAFERQGIDAFAIGLLCRDDLDAGGERWGLRYDECFAIEAAWQRRELARLERRIAAIGAARTEPA